ncbi:hypothetical protein KVR01_004057 [Diaporthe batatas]|uniref:uncharacterized protein n=1 Tax=Diaporthe batatas TaxID=748121 RepID=UPI001D05AB86|nr:uncharacterized protein KVR01_004057 [Diaporthe batatas]KAG8165505.1 hypothetical protein KVR01_004057 [Diaporthe batatas]
MDNTQPIHGQQPNRNSRPTNLFNSLLNGTAPVGGAGSIWTQNPMTDNLSSRDNSGVAAAGQPLHSAQRQGGSEATRWPSSGLGNWPSQDNVQSRPNASRSTSPPSAFQNNSNTSPSFNPGRLTNGQSNTFPTTLAHASNGVISRGSISGPAGRVNSFQSGFGGFARTNSGASAFDDGAAPRDSGLPSSRQSESESAVQYNNEVSGFPQTIPSHSRHASRPSLSAASSSYYQQQQPSRSQSLNPQLDDAALEAARQSLARNMPNNSPAPRFSTVQASTPAPSQIFRWGDWTPGNGVGQTFPQGSRRESLAMSVNQSAMNSPRAFSNARPAEPWASPATAVDLDALSGLQRSQGQLARLPNQLPYADPSPYGQMSQSQLSELQAQAQLMQSVYLQNYTMQAQPYYAAPTGPAAYAGRPGRTQNPFEGFKATPQLLEEFKKTSKGANKKWQLRDIFGFVVDFAGDQQGSRFLQEKIPIANSDDKERVFQEIIVNANQMMTDVFGNYIIQKLFEYGTLAQKKTLALKMKRNVAQLSMNIYGCRCVQEAFNVILVEQQVELAKELEPELLKLMQGVHSNHVIQKIIQKLPREHIDFVYNGIRGKVFMLSTHNYACRVIQRMLEEGTDDDKAFILEEFLRDAHRLVPDEWGNYVTQIVLKVGGPQARAEIIRLCIDQFLVYSKQKHASNVMEHCIELGEPEDRLEMYNLIMNTRTEDGSGLLQAMWKDQYANYVVQKLCFHLRGVEQETLIRESRPYYLSRKKPSRPDEKWAAFENLMSQFRATASRQGSVSSANGDLNGATASRPSSQSDMNSAMPTPALTTGGNSPRTSSSQATNDGPADADTPQPLKDLLHKFGETGLQERESA